MEQGQLDSLRNALEEERRSVDRQLAEHGSPADSETVEVDVDEGFADSAHATAERSQTLALVDQLHGHRREIDAALARMDDGVYGKCEKCGQDIPFERLEARPTATLCVSCKQAGAA
ncbi:MAG: TraR/DksA C4-type zinc finger protein [Actinobacteria bacterium]|nr:TraR/DksA C4-type zinc finger protein [Actinomycetota bacterium]